MVNIGQRRAAFRAFLAANPTLKKSPWEKASQLSEGTIRGFLKRAGTMTDETYEKLASGASKLLGRRVRAAELRGDPGPVDIPLRSYVGAGEEIVDLATDDPPIDWVPAPPGMERAEATEVRGRSMLPLYHDGDLLFHRRLEADPTRYRDEVVIAQVKGGKRYVKLLQPGTRRGRFTLLSVNPAFPALEDLQLDWIGPIEWVHKRWRQRKP